ncbi:MAG: anti-sigma factor family protein [Candidatus Zixiibacteriota bacterium]
MNHSYFKDRISAYFDNELKHEEKQVIEEHLNDCQECRQLLEEFKKFDNMVEKDSGLNDSDYWEQSAQKIEQALEKESNADRKITDVKVSAWKGLRWKLAGVAASVVFIMFIALYEKDITKDFKQSAQTAKPMSLDDSNIPLAVDSITLLEKDKKVAITKEIDNELLPKKSEKIVQESKGDVTVGTVQTLSGQSAEIRKDESIEQPVDINIISRKKLPAPKRKPELAVSVEDSDVRPEGSSIIAKEEESTAIMKTSRVAPDKDELIMLADEAVESQEKPTSELSSDFTIEQWRDKRDSLTSKSLSLSFEHQEDVIQKSVKQKKSDMISTPKGNISDKEKLLVECHYNIALMTEDVNEFRTSLKFLENYSRKDNSLYKEIAKKYIEDLKKGKFYK